MQMSTTPAYICDYFAYYWQTYHAVPYGKTAFNRQWYTFVNAGGFNVWVVQARLSGGDKILRTSENTQKNAHTLRETGNARRFQSHANFVWWMKWTSNIHTCDSLTESWPSWPGITDSTGNIICLPPPQSSRSSAHSTQPPVMASNACWTQ